jgi:hypothetical protein
MALNNWCEHRTVTALLLGEQNKEGLKFEAKKQTSNGY